MNKKFLLVLPVIILAANLTGCSQVHFGRDAVTIGMEKKPKSKIKQKNNQTAEKKKAATSSNKKIVKKVAKKVEKTKEKKPKAKKVVKTNWNTIKTRKLQAAVNKWSKPTGQVYRLYDGIHPIKTKKGYIYPQAFKETTFVLNKKTIKIGWSPLGKNKYKYNVVAIANDNFKSWHNTYLFCLKNNKPVILLDQSEKGGSIIVKTVKDTTLINGFKKVYQN